MSNPGNTGQRFRMSKVTGAEVQGQKVRVHLDCGHDYSVSPIWGTAKELAEIMKGRIGKRGRCNHCEVTA